MAAASSPLSSPPPPRKPESPHEIRAVAVRAGRDPRTVVAAYEGRARSIAVAAVAEAARALGFVPPPHGGR